MFPYLIAGSAMTALNGSGHAPLQRVFISSTFEDLKAHRQAVFDAIQSMGDHADDMIYWSADDASTAANSVRRVRESDLLILVLAHRYGTPAQGATLSITHLEFRGACSAGLPVLAFIVDPEYPWPPKYVEASQQKQLAEFRDEVRREVTVREFTTPENLAIQVTYALAQRLRKIHKTGSRSDLGPAIPVGQPSDLETSPNITLDIGAAEDGLPLVFSVHRARDLAPHFLALERELGLSANEVPHAMLQSFRQSLEDHARASWSRSQVHDLLLPSGKSDRMLVSNGNLAHLFRSVAARLLSAGNPNNATSSHRSLVTAIRTLPPASHGYVMSPEGTGGRTRELESLGGTNRFLGISLRTGARYSVGRRNSGWIVWREFMPEILIVTFPAARATIRTRSTSARVPLQELPSELDLQLGRVRQQIRIPQLGDIGLTVTVGVDRGDVGRMLSRVSRLIHAQHQNGRVHADLKPDNILLTENGVQLIDDFDVEIGSTSPGWTPDWSAPEQQLSRPVGPASDVYPLARMVATLLGAHLTGDILTVRALDASGNPRDFCILRDPTPAWHTRSGESRSSGFDRRPWRDLLKSALRYDPDERLDSAVEFADRVDELLQGSPLPGAIDMRVSGALAIVQSPDGDKRAARCIEDIHGARGASSDWGGALPPGANSNSGLDLGLFGG